MSLILRNRERILFSHLCIADARPRQPEAALRERATASPRAYAKGHVAVSELA